MQGDMMGTVASGILDLLTDSELANDFAITIAVNLLQVIEKAATLADKHQQTTTRAVILLVGLKVFRQLCNPLGEDGDLNLGTPGIGVMRAELLNNVCLFCGCQHSYSYS
jgi:hypothetical protein